MTLTLALLSPQAWGCDRVEVVVEGVEVDVDDCGSYEEEEEDFDPPMAEVADHDEEEHGDSLQLQYGTQFLPDLPGHHLGARLLGERDVYVGGELRYTPSSDLMWTARLGAGFDVFGRSDWDLQLGLFVGTAGEWDRDIDRAVLYAAPIAGTENEITVGYKIIDEFALYGQYLILSPGELDNQGGVGIGVRAEF